MDSKWTIAYLADAVKVDDKHLGNMERGKSINPTFTFICQLAEALEIPVDEIWQFLKQEKEKDKADSKEQ